jgi:hypothetical protein
LNPALSESVIMRANIAGRCAANKLQGVTATQPLPLPLPLPLPVAVAVAVAVAVDVLWKPMRLAKATIASSVAPRDGVQRLTSTGSDSGSATASSCRGWHCHTARDTASKSVAGLPLPPPLPLPLLPLPVPLQPLPLPLPLPLPVAVAVAVAVAARVEVRCVNRVRGACSGRL